MNLFYLLTNQSARLRSEGSLEPRTAVVQGRRWRGVQLEPGASIAVVQASRCQPFRARPSAVGWYASAPHGAAEIEVVFQDSGSGKPIGASATMKLDANAQAIRLPWPLEPIGDDFDLVVRAPASSGGAAFVAVHYPLDRKPLLALCKGRGVELGPGPRPQVFPSDDVDVSYVEQTHPDDWGRLYGGSAEVSFDPNLASRFVVGNADAIPAEPGSLDFIFSSHVFEHLANPLGHLELWSRLLKPGGRVAMIVPDYIGSKDFLMDQTSIEELETEYADGGFALSDAHYEAYGKARGNAALAADLKAKNASIHVHYYTHSNMARVCEWAVERLGYSAFSIVHVDNHKDFHVVLTKG